MYIYIYIYTTMATKTWVSVPNANYQQINFTTPNPFTVRPIHTDFTDNDLILQDPGMRIKARIAPEDTGLIESSKIISPMHLECGWKWK